MPGAAGFSEDGDAAAVARARLDAVNESLSASEAAQRVAILGLVELWNTSAWIAAGAHSAKQWLIAHAGQSARDAARLERIAELCTRAPALADAIADGWSLAKADRLASVVTQARAKFLTQDLVDKLLAITDADDFDRAVAYWRERVDEHLAPQRVHPHAVTVTQRLFGGGEVMMSLASVPFATFCAAMDAWTQDPDPTDSPYQRSLAERRADAVDDMAHFSLTHQPDDDGSIADDIADHLDHHGDADAADNGHGDAGAGESDGDGVDASNADATDGSDHDRDGDGDDEVVAGAGSDRRAQARADEEELALDTFDGGYPGDELDERLDPENAELDDLELLRERLRKAVEYGDRRERRRTRARSGACVNVHVDLRTLAGTRDIADLDDLVLRGEGWHATRAAAERLLCDTTLVVTLFDGKTKILDANTAAERFSKAQRRAIAARDGCCAYPGCTRRPRHCDTHHLDFKVNGGPTSVANGCLLCRFHHRLIHDHGWKLFLDDDGHWTAMDPHGTTWKGRSTAHQTAA